MAKQEFNFAGIGVLALVFIIGLLATTPVANSIFSLTSNSSFSFAIANAYNLAGTAAQSALRLSSVNAQSSLSLPAWLDLNTFLGLFEALTSGVWLVWLFKQGFGN